MKIVFLFLALVLVTVNGEQLLRDDEADETDDALSPFEAFEDIEDIEDIEDRAAKKTKKAKKTKTTGNSTENIDDIEDIEERGDEGIEDRRFNTKYTTGKLIPLGKYYGTKGIPLRVLFTFDTDFVKTFGTTGMNKLVQLAKKHLDSQSLKKLIGTTIKLTGTTRKYSRALKDTGGSNKQGDWPATFQKDAAKQKKYYDVYQYIQGNPKNNGGGVSNGATVCTTGQKSKRISMVMVPTKSDCKADKITSCTNAYRLSKAAKTAAHEIGHTIGMMHDFKTRSSRYAPYVYRKYDSKSCAGGFMSYVNMGKNGWSACSARDFSRFLTKGGTTNPCLNYKTLNSDNRKSCGSSCYGRFKMQCMKGWFSSSSCSAAYSKCVAQVNYGSLATDCAKGCKPTTTMAALKSKC